MPLGIPILPVHAGMPPLPPKGQQRMRKYGGCESCQACIQVCMERKTNVFHSDACRRRIEELVKKRRLRKGEPGCLEKAKSKRPGM